MAPTPKGRSRAAMLYFVFNADVVAVLVAHDLRVGEFVAQARLSGPGWGTFCLLLLPISFDRHIVDLLIMIGSS